MQHQEISSTARGKFLLGLLGRGPLRLSLAWYGSKGWSCSGPAILGGLRLGSKGMPRWAEACRGEAGPGMAVAAGLIAGSLGRVWHILSRQPRRVLLIRVALRRGKVRLLMAVEAMRGAASRCLLRRGAFWFGMARTVAAALVRSVVVSLVMSRQSWMAGAGCVKPRQGFLWL